MELRQVTYFLKVAETLHYGRAARELGVTTQPLSFQIKKLEQELGYDLFWRTTRSVRLTPQGEAFRRHAIIAVAELEAAVLAGRTARTLAISCAGTIPMAALSDVMARFTKVTPDVRISISERIGAGDTDVSVIELASSQQHPESSSVLQSHGACVAVPAGHALARLGRPLRGEDLAGEKLIAIDAHACPADDALASDVMSDLGVSWQPSLHAESASTALALVSASLGVFVTSRAAESLGAQGVALVPVESSATMDVLLCWDEATLSPTARAFVDIARA